MFGRRTKLDNDKANGSSRKKQDDSRKNDDKATGSKRETIMNRFQENGYDSGFVYHED